MYRAKQLPRMNMTKGRYTHLNWCNSYRISNHITPHAVPHWSVCVSLPYLRSAGVRSVPRRLVPCRGSCTRSHAVPYRLPYRKDCHTVWRTALNRNVHRMAYHIAFRTPYNRMIAILGWKIYKYHYETDELPNPRPTQPKKK